MGKKHKFFRVFSPEFKENLSTMPILPRPFQMPLTQGFDGVILIVNEFIKTEGW